MSQSLSKIYIHLVFHIKTTSPQIRTADLERVHSYIGQMVNQAGCVEVQTGGVGDHVHVLFLLSKNVALSHVVEEVKRNSSRWLKTIAPYYRMFAWQSGYAAFSVSQSVSDKTLQYICHQQEHHQKTSFADEFKRFLGLYQVKFDESVLFRD